VDVNRVERPIMRGRGGAEILFGLRQGNQQAALVARDAGKQKRQCQRGLASAWSALHEMHSTAGKSAPENVIQPYDASQRTVADGRAGPAAIAARSQGPLFFATSASQCHRANHLISNGGCNSQTL
jgi:hypothetical protein